MNTPSNKGPNGPSSQHIYEGERRREIERALAAKEAEAAKPPHMDPMSANEVRDLLTATRNGPLPEATVQRMTATLAAWLVPFERDQARQRIMRDLDQ